MLAADGKVIFPKVKVSRLVCLEANIFKLCLNSFKSPLTVAISVGSIPGVPDNPKFNLGEELALLICSTLAASTEILDLRFNVAVSWEVLTTV